MGPWNEDPGVKFRWPTSSSQRGPCQQTNSHQAEAFAKRPLQSPMGLVCPLHPRLLLPSSSLLVWSPQPPLPQIHQAWSRLRAFARAIPLACSIFPPDHPAPGFSSSLQVLLQYYLRDLHRPPHLKKPSPLAHLFTHRVSVSSSHVPLTEMISLIHSLVASLPHRNVSFSRADTVPFTAVCRSLKRLPGHRRLSVNIR